MVGLLINDNGRTYDTQRLVAHAEGKQEMDRAVYAEANRLIYLRYTYIRQLLSNSSCRQPMLYRMKVMLEDEEQRQRVRSVFEYTDEEIDFYLFFVEKFIKLVR